MQLTIRDLTKLLHAEESTVTRWIKKGNLPAHQVSGQYRVNRSELLEWATAKQIKISLELFDYPEEVEAGPSLAEALDAGGVHYGLQDTNKMQALHALVQVLPIADGDREQILHLFLAREASASTAIGDGIAIPHVRNPIVLHVARPMVTLAFLTKPVEFGALDGKPVHVFFSIISATTREHLQLLSRLSFALHDELFRQAVMRQAAAHEILAELRRLEARLDNPMATVGKDGR